MKENDASLIYEKYKKEIDNDDPEEYGLPFGYEADDMVKTFVILNDLIEKFIKSIKNGNTVVYN